MPSSEDDRILLIALAQINFLTRKEKIILLKNLDSVDTLALLSINDISACIGRLSRSVSWNGKAAVDAAVRADYIMRRCGISYMPVTDLLYPPLLKETVDAPFMLFYRGNAGVLGNRSVSVVGTRKLTPDGAEAAFTFAGDAAADGLTVVSGLAFGTDARAHEGAVRCGVTAAVLPGGIDEIVPRMHARLAVRILENGGCILSEYAPGTPAAAWRFVQRNRIIAALTPATVVIQAPPGSGALLTADFALDYGRDVLFHEASFSAAAEKCSALVGRQLEQKVARGEKSRYKLEKRPEKYVADGAPVIKNYRDYTRCLAEMPGERNCMIRDQQLSLFEKPHAEEG